MNTLFIGQNIIKPDSIESTNSYANELLKRENLPEGTVIWTRNQTSGRGQRGNTWESEAFANLTLSLVLQPSFLLVHQQFYLNKAISLAVADFVSAILKEKAQNDQKKGIRLGKIPLDSGITETKVTPGRDQVSVKWPNDIYVGSQKIAGILIENSVRNDNMVNSIAGIGVNINQEIFSKGIPNPTSLKLICNRIFDVEKCLVKLCSFIEANYLLLKSGHFKKMDERYKQLLYRFDEWADYNIGEKRVRAKIIDISTEGKLVVETSDKNHESFGFKEISFVP